jgi:ATP-dependent Lon protease
VFAKIEKIGAEQPNFHEATEIILNTLYAQCLSGMPACLPPLLMNGGAGVGKTRYMKRITKALDLPICDISLAGISDTFPISGLSRYWKGAGPGNIAITFANSMAANPVFMLDEIDKSHKSWNGDPLSRILLLLEKETSTTFKDDFINLPMDVSHASYIATCNRKDLLPEPLLNRFICVNIEPLDYKGRCIFVNTVYQELCVQEKYGAFFIAELSQETMLALVDCEGLAGRELKLAILQGMQRACREIVLGDKPNKSVVLKVSHLQLLTKNQTPILM